MGRVTKPGLDQPVGNAAINHVPREMIEKEVREVCELLDFKGTLDIIISVPKGKELAERTFNPRLGIVGGISILGTSGIVEPMSSQALIDTIRVELRQRYSFGYDYVAVAPGNYGLDFMKESYGYDLARSLLYAAVEEEGDVGIFFGLSDAQLGQAQPADIPAENVLKRVVGEGH